ncbi:hypothetical protein [Lignipirellula cremea]|uniref:Uncharacterized protein n=1 Tax=Lignipirellula cremea TaxID=2528010 RepID=A0A518DQN4_9BACT|nr:hypothetical protein [Lignipirellula cremea]QDU94132.1 hypothetical protein Pla8534_19180 [Lignipirellula cremea]
MQDNQTTTLTIEQQEEAKFHEKIIDDGLAGYVEIGLALRAIQAKKLHTGKFIDYAIDRFGMKSHTIYRFMRSAQVAKNLMDAELPRPKNAGQAHRLHELFKDDPADQVALWRKVVESGVPIVLSQIDRIAKQIEDGRKGQDEDDADLAGEVDLDSAHHVEPVTFPPSDADPLPCLRRAAQELRSVGNAIDDGFDDLEPLHEEMDRLSDLLEGIRSKLAAVSIAA